MATDDGKIYITISDERGQNNLTTPTTTTTTQKAKNKEQIEENESALSIYAQHEFLHLIKQQAIQQVNFDIQNIGFITGNYTHQRHVQEAYTLGSKLVGIGVSFMAGGVIGGILAIAGSTINLAREEWKYNEQIKRQNKNITQLRYISGLDNYTNGSR